MNMQMNAERHHLVALGSAPSLLINPESPASALLQEGLTRQSAAREMLVTMTLASSVSNSLDGRDISNIAHPANLLLADAEALIEAAFERQKHELRSAS